MPYLAFTGKAFRQSGFQPVHQCCLQVESALLQQAWFDVQLKKQFAIRVGKFKTPFLACLPDNTGRNIVTSLPVSLTSSVILPYSLNAVTPNIGTGFDLGVEVHGLVAG